MELKELLAEIKRLKVSIERCKNTNNPIGNIYIANLKGIKATVEVVERFMSIPVTHINMNYFKTWQSIKKELGII